MKKKLFLTATVVLFSTLAYCQTEVFQSEKLKKLWETTGLDVPESVLPVADQGKIYVSNIGGSNPAAKENKGFISILDLDGKIIALKWVVGLNSPKGMAIFGNNLYVSDVDRIAEIDLKTGRINKFFNVEGSAFLNDIAVSADGKLYITDSQTKKVFLFENGHSGEMVKSDAWGYPNGIINYNNKLLVGVGDRLIQVDPVAKTYEDFILNTGSIDGLAIVEKDAFIFSYWSGKIYIMKKGKEMELLLDTSKTEKLKSADFGYLADKKILFVPTFFGNSVVCYQLTEY